MKQDNFSTKDIFEASYLYSQNLKLLGIKPDGRYSWFIFGEPTLCTKLSQDYWAQKAEGNIRLFVNSYKTLKDLVFSQKGGF